LVKTHADVRRFVRLLLERRLLRDVEHERKRVSLNAMIATARKAWHGVKPRQPDWSDGEDVTMLRDVIHLLDNSQ
jgi:glycogen operon protein